MARPRLRSPQQSWPVWLLCAATDVAASLVLAVVTILLLAAVLGLATFVESAYGTPAAHFGVYGTWWFEALNALLAINIFFAAAVRYPWKRYQTGFVITHIGLLILLYGCWMARRGGVDAQIPIKEGRSNNVFYEDALFVRVEVSDGKADAGVPIAAREGVQAPPATLERIDVPIATGPFNWVDYRAPFDPTAPFASLGMRLFAAAHRDEGPLTDPRLASAGIKLDVLDFCSNGRQVRVPYLNLLVRMRPKGEGMPGMSGAGDDMPMEMSIVSRDDALRHLGLGKSFPGFDFAQRQRQGGGSFGFWMVPSKAAVEDFLTRPDPKEPGYGEQGQVILTVAGTAYRFKVDDHAGKASVPLGNSGWTANFGRTATIPMGEGPPLHSVEVTAVSPEGSAERLVLFAEQPEMNIFDPKGGIFGSYWVDTSKLTGADLMAGMGGARVDIIQGPSLTEPGKSQLYYRRWNRSEVVAAEPLTADGREVPAFEMSRAEVSIRLAAPSDWRSSDEPAEAIVPLPFDKKQGPGATTRMARLRLTVGDRQEEFWLEEFGLMEDITAQAEAEDHEAAVPRARPLQRFATTIGGKKYEVSLRPKQIEVGYRIKCLEFQKKMDPGSDSVRHYGCRIDFLDPNKPGEAPPAYLTDVKIGMNAPIDFNDPASQRSYRLFQESYRGPLPDAGGKPRYITFLTVNYNPGRGTQYLGSLLIVLGIMTMFWMRAYFFRPNPRKVAVAEEPETASPPDREVAPVPATASVPAGTTPPRGKRRR